MKVKIQLVVVVRLMGKEDLMIDRMARRVRDSVGGMKVDMNLDKEIRKRVNKVEGRREGRMVVMSRLAEAQNVDLKR